MTKTIKSFVTTLLISGVAFATTQAGAVPTPKPSVTNAVVLENISIALKVYSQGLLGGTGSHAPTGLKANIASLKTSDILKQLSVLTTDAFTYESGDKLVAVLNFTNLLFGTPGTVITNSTTDFAASPTNGLYVVGSENGTNTLVFNPAFTNYYTITNGVLLSNNVVGTNVTTTTVENDLTNNEVLSSSNVVATIPTNYIRSVTGSGSVAYWTTIAASYTTNSTNVTITVMSPTGVYIYTNGSSYAAVLTPAKGKAVPSDLIPVSSWIEISSDSGIIYNETGKGLSGDDFSGTNITTQTGYGIGYLRIHAVYPTNTPAGFTNISVQGSGFGSTTTDIKDLTATGSAKNFFQIPGNSTFPVAGYGFVAGTFTTNTLQTNVYNGVTSTNDTVSASDDLGTNYISGGYLMDTTNVLINGSVTVTYLSAATNITVITP